MRAIEAGNLLPGAIKINNGNRQDVWRGVIQMSSGKKITAFVKHIPPRALAVEMIAALLGRSLELPIPRPILVNVLPIHLPSAKIKEKTIFFGSARVDQPDLAQWLSDEESEEVMDRLRKWKHAIDAGCFDEWLANEDRHSKNILFDGKKDFVLIDHSHAIPESLLCSEASNRNTILEVIAQDKTLVELNGIRKAAKQRMTHKYHKNQPLPILLNSLAEEMKDYLKFAPDLIKFLNDRLPYVETLVARRLGSTQIDIQEIIGRE